MCCGTTPRPLPKPPDVHGPVAPDDGSIVVECRDDTVPIAAQSRNSPIVGWVDQRGRLPPTRDRPDTVPTADQLSQSPLMEHPPISPGPVVDFQPVIEPHLSPMGVLVDDSDEDWVSDEEYYRESEFSEDDDPALAHGTDVVDAQPVSLDHYLFDARAEALRAMDLTAVPTLTLYKVLGREAAFDAVLQRAWDHNHPPLIEESVQHLWKLRRMIEVEHAVTIQRNITTEFHRLGLTPPCLPAEISDRGFNLTTIRAYSEYLRTGAGSLEALIRLIRGQTAVDPRPNKALIIPDANFPYKALWHEVVQHGATAQFKAPLPIQNKPPRNHKSWREAWEVVIPDIAKGAAAGEYLILDGDILPLMMANGWVWVSPFGAAEKQGRPITECARIVHDESYPRKGLNLNAQSVKLEIPMKYDGPKAIARWALSQEHAYPGSTVMMTGDVASAFRNVAFHAAHCGFFSGFIPELNIIVINLVLPFGWTNSPAYYWLAGAAIKTLHGMRFKNLVWCDDHILLESRLAYPMAAAAYSLRRAMILMLGTGACNESKFTVWSRQCKALGLWFDLDAMTVSMPEAKIAKVLGRLLALLALKFVTARDLRKAVGLLRHISICVPASKAFYNRLQARLVVLEKVGLPLPLGAGATEDVEWLVALYRSNSLNGISMDQFTKVRQPDHVINMDASDSGVCGVWHARKIYFSMQWNDTEKKLIAEFKNRTDMQFGINFREFLGAYFAMVLWCAEFGKGTHVRFRIDNTTAVAWTDGRSCRHLGAQAGLRLMGLMEAVHHVCTSAVHIPGVENVWTDAGSRLWSSPEAELKFSNMSSGYLQVAVEEPWRSPLCAWEHFCNTQLLPGQAKSSIPRPGVNGAIGAQ